MVEGVWDGEFARGEFHHMDSFFGSGLRVDGESVHFVPSIASVDRLLFCLSGRNLLVSNSISLLLSFTGARIDPAHDYRKESYTILKGLRHYEKRFAVLHPSIECFYQVYGENLLIRGGCISFFCRPSEHSFDTFSSYLQLMQQTLQGIRQNYQSTARRFPMDSYCTLSSGYDSSMVAALVKDIGVTTCFSSRRSNSLLPPWLFPKAAIDDGKPIADCLGLKTIYLERNTESISTDELYFLAPSCAEPEIVFHSMAQLIEKSGSVGIVFTGFHGDKVWDIHTHGKYLTDEVIRGDTSGLNLSEIRLKAGFINVSLPFLYARHIRSLITIAGSPEMEPWRLHNQYDRPIPRRVVEGAGVPRFQFGYRKKAVVQHYAYPINRQLRREFFDSLRKEHGLTPLFIYGHTTLNKGLFMCLRLAHRLRSWLTNGPEKDTNRVLVCKSLDLPYLLFTWALNRLSEKLATERCLKKTMLQSTEGKMR
jgi:hypothetical protein